MLKILLIKFFFFTLYFIGQIIHFFAPYFKNSLSNEGFGEARSITTGILPHY